MNIYCYAASLVFCLAVPVIHAGDVIPVKTRALADIAIYPQRSAPATVVSLNETVISSEVAARVLELPVRVGDIAEQGSTLARLDCADYELAARQARANLQAIDARIDLAQKRLQRTRTLTLKQSVSEEVLDERISDLAVLQAERDVAGVNLETAELNISRCRVTSPFRALVTERIAATGEFAAKGNPLVRLVDISEVEISAQVPVDEIEQIERGGNIRFEHSGRVFPLRLRTVLPLVNTLTRNREVRLMFSQEAALTGAAGKLIWVDPRPHLPADLLVRRNGNPGIFTGNQGVATFIPLPGALTGRSTAVDLPDDTRIVIEGHFALQDQDRLQIAD